MGFSSWPNFTQEEADTIHRVLMSNHVNYWTGEEGRGFEKEFASWAETSYATAMMNGTVALDVAFKALDIGSGDEVIVSSRTFMASVSSIVNVGASPVFVDISRDSQNITLTTVSSAITPRTKAIVCVHLAGWPCEMDGIMALAKEFGLYVIEDCAQAHGAKYKGKPVGSIGHIGCWSFCQDKIMTTGGEGGMVTTNDHELWSKMWSYKDHGKSWDAVYDKRHPPGFRWVHDSFGSNYRMTEMQAVIGRIQLKRMGGWHQERKTNADRILDTCRAYETSLRVPILPDYVEHAWYKCYVFVRADGLKNGWDRDRIVKEINVLGVPCFQGSCSEVYLEKAFENTGYRPEVRLPIAKELGETSIMFLVHPGITLNGIEKTCDGINRVMIEASI